MDRLSVVLVLVSNGDQEEIVVQGLDGTDGTILSTHDTMIRDSRFSHEGSLIVRHNQRF